MWLRDVESYFNDKIVIVTIPVWKLPAFMSAWEISSNVTHLQFGNFFNQPLGKKIPSTVKHIRFGINFDQPVIGSIPNSVTHLIFGYSFNQPIENAIPSSIIHLEFGFCFDQCVDSISSFDRLKFLKFVRGMRLSPTKTFVNVKYFEPGLFYKINPGILRTVTHLKLNYYFNQSLENILSDSIIYLGLGHDFQQPFEKNIPSSVTTLLLGCGSNQLDKIPLSVTHLKFENYFSEPLQSKIPNSVTHLHFGKDFLETEHELPLSITHLIINRKLSRKLIKFVPKSVIRLRFENGSIYGAGSVFV